MTYRIQTVAELQVVALEWLKKYPEPTICLLNGDMGVGKTTFVKAICDALEVEEQVSSPTFSLVNEYEGSNGQKIFHFDLYRVENEDELYELGFEEYLEQSAYVFIEWPKIGSPFFFADTPAVKIQLENQHRLISF